MSDPESQLEGPIFTIGHSTRTIGKFLELLAPYTIEILVDVRSFPGSRRLPQFNRDALAKALNNAGIAYNHMVTLGGKRKKTEDAAPDSYARNIPFATYVEYSRTPIFRNGLTELETLARRHRVAIMCAEADWTQCHRSIIAQELIKEGFAVTHIMDAGRDGGAALSPRLPGF